MKSSSVKRSTLSRESMDIIENLANEEPVNYTDTSYYNEEENNIPGEYIRESSNTPETKAQEIDLLWQSFKSAQFNSSSPQVWLLVGFIAGSLITLMLLGMFGMISIKNENKSAQKVTSIEKIDEDLNLKQEMENTKLIIKEEAANIAASEISAEEKTISKPKAPHKTFKRYTIKSGDTVDAIIKHFYGKYTPERAQAIMKANNLQNLDVISIGQVLIIPVEE